MTVAEALPSLCVDIAKLKASVLSEQFDPTDCAQFEVLFFAVLIHQSENGHDINRLAATTQSLIGELVTGKIGRGHAEIASLNVLQLCAATGVLGQCMTTAQLARAGDWFVASLNDSLSFDSEWPHGSFDVARLAELLQGESEFLKLNGALIVCQWAAQAYLYLRRMRTYEDLGQTALGPCVVAAERCVADGFIEGIEALLRMAEWAVSVGSADASTLVQVLEGLYDITAPAVSAKIAGTLSSNVGSLSTHTPHEWAERVYQHHWADTDPGVRIMVLAELCTDSALYMQHKAEVLLAVGDFTESGHEADPFTREQFLEASFRAINPFVNLLLRSGLTGELLTLLSVYYGVNDHALSDAIVVAPAFETFCIWASTTSTHRIEHPAAQTLRRVIIAANRALRIVLSLDDGETGFEESGPFDLRQHGQPDDAFGQEFESATNSFFCLASVDVSTLPGPPTPAIPLTSIPLPFQAATLHTLGITWPISTSLQSPLLERQIKRVGIWHHPLLHGEWEVDIIRTCFDGIGVDCRVETSGGSGERDRFIDLYSDKEVDVIWVIGHGDKPGYEPDNASLDILVNSQLTVKQLCDLPVPESETSRLLVLNVCSAAATVTYGGLPRVSLAALLTKREQKVIAHLWPTQALVATAFGAFLGDALAKGGSFFDAFVAVLSALDRDSTSIAKDLALLRGGYDLSRAVSATATDFTSMLNCGSPVFLQ